MKFTLIDRIIEIEPGRKIKAVKGLSMCEDYLSDHFPGYPVMPGVLMLEAMIQTAAWLIRVENNFSTSIIIMVEARNITYGRFVSPGEQLTLEAELISMRDGRAKFRGKGTLDNKTVVKGRFELKYFNLSDSDASLTDNDRIINEIYRKKLEELGGANLILTPQNTKEFNTST